jgi:hypothetical protein
MFHSTFTLMLLSGACAGSDELKQLVLNRNAQNETAMFYWWTPDKFISVNPRPLHAHTTSLRRISLTGWHARGLPRFSCQAVLTVRCGGWHGSTGGQWRFRVCAPLAVVYPSIIRNRPFQPRHRLRKGECGPRGRALWTGERPNLSPAHAPQPSPLTTCLLHGCAAGYAHEETSEGKQ